MTSSSHDTLRVTTPDNVGIGYDVAGLGSRMIAQLIDTLIVGAVLFVVLIFVGALFTTNGSSDQAVLVGVAIFGVVILVYVAYFAVCELLTGGRTPGKSAGGLRVLDISGSAPTAIQLLVRNLARFIDVIFGVGVVVMFCSRHSRRIGDLLAGTVVVRVRPQTSFAAVVTPPPVMLRTPDAGPPIEAIEGLGERELAALRTFLSRAGLEPALRARLAAQLSARLLDRLQLPADAPERQWSPELFLERLFLQLQNRAAT